MFAREMNFTCDCGHKEDDHEWDPYSSFFGMCKKSLILQVSDVDGTYMIDEDNCPCQRFRIDNLRFLEELNEQRRKTKD